jgi:hypothetical protein
MRNAIESIQNFAAARVGLSMPTLTAERSMTKIVPGHGTTREVTQILTGFDALKFRVSSKFDEITSLVGRKLQGFGQLGQNIDTDDGPFISALIESNNRINSRMGSIKDTVVDFARGIPSAVGGALGSLKDLGKKLGFEALFRYAVAASILTERVRNIPNALRDAASSFLSFGTVVGDKLREKMDIASSRLRGFMNTLHPGNIFAAFQAAVFRAGVSLDEMTLSSIRSSLTLSNLKRQLVSTAMSAGVSESSISRMSDTLDTADSKTAGLRKSLKNLAAKEVIAADSAEDLESELRGIIDDAAITADKTENLNDELDEMNVKSQLTGQSVDELKEDLREIGFTAEMVDGTLDDVGDEMTTMSVKATLTSAVMSLFNGVLGVS